MNPSETPASEIGGIQNILEKLLADAALSEAARPAFYQELLAGTIYICPHELVETSPTDETKGILKLATITHDGVDYIPFYTSPRYVPEGMSISQIPAKLFFEVIKGSFAVINPGHVPMKTFTPSEIDRLLSGAILAPEKQFAVTNNAQIDIGAPPSIPPKLIEQLSAFFSRDNHVIRAWLGWYRNPELEARPGYLLALETHRADDFAQLAGKVSLVMREVGIGSEYCDIVRYTNSGITRYFSDQRPFYSMSFGRRILSYFL